MREINTEIIKAARNNHVALSVDLEGVSKSAADLIKESLMSLGYKLEHLHGFPESNFRVYWTQSEHLC